MDPVGNKIVLAGHGGFFAHALAQRFRKEGWDVFFLGEREEGEEAKDPGVHFCAYPGSAPEAADLFRTHAITCILYLPERKMAESHFRELQAVLQLGHAFKIRRFFFLSSAEVFSPGGAAKREEDVPSPVSTIGKQYCLAEGCVREWRKIYDLPAVILRCSDIYGPGQTPEDGWTGNLLFRLSTGQPVPEAPADAERDVLYVDDAVFAVFQAVARDFEGDTLHISSGEGILWKEFKTLLPGASRDVTDQASGGGETYAQAVLFSERCSRELGWRPRMKPREGLEKAYLGMKEYLAHQETAGLQKKQAEELARRKKLVIPYLENLAGFFLMALIAKLQGDLVVNPAVYFDMNFLYIGTMGLLYGKRQSLLACALSTILFLWTLMSHGMDAVGILYVPQYLLHVTSYLFAAILTGYFADRRSNEMEAWRWEESQHVERYGFLRRMYQENTEIKDKLYHQMINMDDSIGRLYLILRRLDSVEVENIFTQAAVVISEIMDVPDVAIYVMSRDRHFMRQRVRLGEGTMALPHSRRVEDHAFIRTVTEDRFIFVNRDLDKTAPDLAAPIVYRGEVLAVIEIFGMDFDQWNLNQQNLLSITARIISSSIARAYEYEENIQDRKYYGTTHILVEEEFCRILDAIQLRSNLQKNFYMALLHVKNPEGISYEEIDEKLSRAIRVEDFVGLLGGEVYVLLFDMKGDVADLILNRIKGIGLDAEISEAVTAS